MTLSGASISPTPATGIDVISGQITSASLANSQRIQLVADRIKLVLCSGRKNLSFELYNPCVALARGIDYAVANNEIPCQTQELSLLVKQLCQHHNDNRSLQAAIMVLMVSVKNACKRKWFSDKDTEELLSLSNKIGSIYCMPENTSTEASHPLPVISSVMDRYYPLLKMGQILAHVEVKPGYGTYVVDFHISKNAGFSPQDKIRLFVAEIDNIETSSCILSPKKVNILLNGKGVDRRMNATMQDSGRQIPTNVTAMLKYGTNLLQVLGQFEGHYIIALAFMSEISPRGTPVLQDYVQPVVASQSLDSEVIEGPSRISLSCPISCSRIKTPVKGHVCKHIQCFDYDNFVAMNTRRPSWRCPCCNQPVCHLDIRIDQNMVKVLKEVGENVVDVIISSDGSWKTISESNNREEQPHEKICDYQKDSFEQQGKSLDALLNVFDLTEEDDAKIADIFETGDRKPDLHNNSGITLLMTLSELNNGHGVNQSTASQVEDNTNGLHFPDAQGNDGSALPSLSDSMVALVPTDAISPALSQQLVELRGTNYTNLLRSQIPSPNNLQLQQFQSLDSVFSNEYGRITNVPRHLNRTPTAIQALPATSMTPDPRQRSRTSSLTPNGSLTSSQHHLVPQSPSHPHHSFSSTQSVQRVTVPAASQFPGNYRMTTGHRIATQQIAQMARQSQPLPVQNQTSRTGHSFPNNVNGFRASVRDQRQAVQQVSRAENLVDLSLEQNWQPTARMRGSLSGQAYSDALSQFMSQPTPPTQSTPPTNLTSPPAGVPPQLHALITNHLNIYAPASQTQDHTVTNTANLSGSAGSEPG